jgi:hypothetical protein
LSAQEQEHLAVLRVAALAADPAQAKMSARRVDVLVVLATVDRLSSLSRVDTLTVIRDSYVSLVLRAGSVTVDQRFVSRGGGDAR